MNPNFLRQVEVMAILTAIADVLYRVFMGVIYGFALASIFYPFWSY